MTESFEKRVEKKKQLFSDPKRVKLRAKARSRVKFLANAHSQLQRKTLVKQKGSSRYIQKVSSTRKKQFRKLNNEIR